MRLRHYQVQTQDDMAETTVVSNTANLPSQPIHQPGAKKPVDKTYRPMQPETKDPCPDGSNPYTLTPNQKHPTLPGNTLTPNTIYRYILSESKMVSSLNLTHANNGSHHEPDIIDKTKDDNRNKLELKPTQHIPSNRIYPIDIDTIIGSSVHHNLHVGTADIANYAQRTPLFDISLPTTLPTTDHSTLLTTPTTPQLPTTDDPRSTHTSYAPCGIIHPATITSDNHSVTPVNELHGHPTLVNPRSQFDINTDQPNDAEAQHQPRSYCPHTVITTVVASTTACNIPHGRETHTRHNTTDTSQAFRPRTDNASTFTTTVQFPATALAAHLQRLFHPPPIPPLIRITNSILAQPITVPTPTDLSHQHHYSTKPHQQRTAPTRDHKTLALASHTMTTTAATDGLQQSKIPKTDEKEDPKRKKHTAYETYRPTLTVTQRNTYYRLRTTHLPPHAVTLRMKTTVRHPHRTTVYHTGTHRQIYCKSYCKSFHRNNGRKTCVYQQAFYFQANLIAEAQKSVKIQTLNAHNHFNSTASWNKDSLKPP